MFTVGAIIDRPQTTAKPKRATNGRPYKRISAETTLVFSADLCYNGVNEKPPSEREGDRVSGGRSLRDFRFVLTLL